MKKPLKHKIVVSDDAWEMPESHIVFLANANPDAAEKVRDRLLDAIRSLAEMPGRHPFFNEEYITPDKYRRMFVEKWYLVLYQVKDGVVFVDYVVDCRQDYGWLMQ